MIRLFKLLWRHIHTILVQMMTDGKDQTDPFRVWGSFGFLSIVVLMSVALFKGSPFAPLEYGGALSGYLLAWGGASYAKAKGEAA